MSTINADKVRIPRAVRDAVRRHEPVIVLNRDQAVMAIVHPDDLPQSPTRRLGRPIGEIAALLANVPRPDPDFVKDMEAVRANVGETPEDPWARS
jgi:hypothetical protein